MNTMTVDQKIAVQATIAHFEEIVERYVDQGLIDYDARKDLTSVFPEEIEDAIEEANAKRPTPKRNTAGELARKFSQRDPNEVVCSILWQREDVHQQAEDDGVELTDKEADEVLILADSNHDAEQGISWETLSACINRVIADRK